ncbi:MAG TPA: hypothetical protein VJ656_14930 [Pyrinomonadaceae bacterium]|nr:hypothetical protein [Pyrinomonadaceae bacterium]
MKKTTRSPKPFQTAVMVLLLVSIISPSVTLSAGTSNQDPPTAENVKVIPDGTEFTVVTIDEITSKTAAEGDPLTFKVARDVTIDGQIVVAKDSLVKGIVAQAKKAGMMGRGGSLGIRVESATTVDNQKLKLRSTKGKEGDDKTGTTVALVVLFGPLGFLKKGKNAVIKPGTEIKVYTDEEKKVTIKNQGAGF